MEFSESAVWEGLVWSSQRVRCVGGSGVESSPESAVWGGLAGVLMSLPVLAQTRGAGQGSCAFSNLHYLSSPCDLGEPLTALLLDWNVAGVCSCMSCCAHEMRALVPKLVRTSCGGGAVTDHGLRLRR